MRYQVPENGFLSVYNGKVMLVDNMVQSVVCHSRVQIRRNDIMVASIADGLVWATQYDVVYENYGPSLRLLVEVHTEDMI